MRIRIALPVVLCIVILYVFFFPFNTGSELVYMPNWAVSVYGGNGEATTSDVHGFIISDTAGFITANGEVLHSEKRLYNATVNNDFLINYSSISENLVLLDHSGKLKENIKISGYPLFIDNRLFVFSSNRSGITEIGLDGTILWSREYGDIITCIDANEEHLLIGFLSGASYLMNNEGMKVAGFKSEFNRISAVYGCALSSNSRLLVILAGIDPQNLIVHELVDGEYKKTRIIESKDVFRRAVRIRISPDNGFLYYEGQNRLYYLNLKNGRLIEQPLDGDLTALHADSDDGLVYSLVDSETGKNVVISEPWGVTLLGFQLPDETDYVDTFPNQLVVGIDDYIYSYHIEVR